MKRKSWKLLIAGISIILLAILFITMIWTFFQNNNKVFEPSKEVFGNPLMGYAPCAWNTEVREDVSLLYMDITWAELEPEEGQYNWDAIEKKNHLNRWREEGKHIVLRFVCDVPGAETHMDIPQWLYEKIDHAGTWYNVSFGQGFSPDYSNEQFISCHQKAVEAMGKYLGQDGLISYIELGSLGHWGEWHVNYSAGIQRLPLENVREEYITPWINAFPDAIFLMRRPFSHADKYGMGLYNDMAGEPNETRAWLNEIENAGYLSQTEEENGLSSMTDFWKSAPVGGEFTSSLSMEDMLSTNLSQTVQLIQESHTTFLGPNTANSKYLKGYQTILKNMGYRIWISEATLSSKLNGTRLKLTWENNGAAPFYKDWPVWGYITDENGNILQKEQIELNLSSLLPGKIIQTDTQLDIRVPLKLIGEKYHISVGVEDPMTGKDSIRFAMQCDFKNGENYLW